jgi:squalene-hopene/tetraprenyl-beta-curcumene cyclase
MAGVKVAYERALAALLSERNADGYWTGELSTSALSTATAVSALALVHQKRGRRGVEGGRNYLPGALRPPPFTLHPLPLLIAGGLEWLARHQNADGGWGDTVKSHSNISTSMLARAAFYLAGAADHYAACLHRVEAWLKDRAGPTAETQSESVRVRYGKDRTFAVPILTTCALAGLVCWDEVAPLPFELACLPQSWFRFLRLPVVSYALPALIAIGQAGYRHRPPRNPLSRLVRPLAAGRSLRVLEAIQPSSGGFLEAVPLTSFVTLSLASIGHADYPVARRSVEFLASTVRPDKGWPIDSNLSAWLTTLAVGALAAAGELPQLAQLPALHDWLLARQFVTRHPYTGAAPGGWGWTHLPGSVPDADDTAGALLALAHLGTAAKKNSQRASEFDSRWKRTQKSAGKGVGWLMQLQNRDGGWPTFCRGWGHLPFDRSGADLTAHALRALAVWLNHGFGPSRLEKSHVRRAINRGFAYLEKTQRADGSWLPLWFGNQDGPDDENPTYGTARVLAAFRDLDRMNTAPAQRGIAWLLESQNADGGWAGGSPSVEESALTVEVLLDAGPAAEQAVSRGLNWLVEQVMAGKLDDPAPIGFYFAKLWYFEKLYPVIFTVAALGRALNKF